MSSYKQRLQQITDELLDEVLAYRVDRKSRAPKVYLLPKIKLSIEKFIRDSVAITRAEAKLNLASIHKDKNHYTGLAITYDAHVVRTYGALIALGYLKQTKLGVSDGVVGKFLTRYVATPKLIKKFDDDLLKVLPVVIGTHDVGETIRCQENITIHHEGKMPTKKSVKLSYLNTDATNAMRNRLAIINQAIDTQWIDLEMSDADLVALARLMRTEQWQKDHPDAEPSINMSKRKLYRTFNDVKFTTGGRFYGGWWQGLPKDARRQLMVNGRRLVEVDYSGLHPTILYHKKGLAAPIDPYNQVLDQLGLDNDLLGLTGKNEEMTRRDAIKVAVNAMLNAPNPLQRAPNNVHIKLLGLKSKSLWNELSTAILLAFKDIEQYFYTGAGSWLMRLDSDIAEKVLLHFAKHQKGPIPCLPMHDSFLIDPAYDTELVLVMRQAYRDVTGFTFNIDQKIKLPVLELHDDTQVFGHPPTTEGWYLRTEAFKYRDPLVLTKPEPLVLTQSEPLILTR